MNKKKWLVTAAVAVFLVFTVAFNMLRRSEAGRSEPKKSPLQEEAMHISPFAGVRWRVSVAEVELKGGWYQLMSLNGVPADDIVNSLKKTYGKVWRKRFEEDLVLALTEMGKGAPFDKATLEVRQLDSAKTVVFKGVPWTKENRKQILLAAINRTKANASKDPRDDPSYP